MEAIKLVLTLGDSLAGRILVYDALEQDFMTLDVARDPACVACSNPDAPPQIVDYDDTCRPPA